MFASKLVCSLVIISTVVLLKSISEEMIKEMFLLSFYFNALRKHAYLNILKILPPKNNNFSIKNSDVFHVSAQNIDCGYSLEPPRRGCSNEYPPSMFSSKNKENNIYPCKPQFCYKKVGFKGVKII